MLARTFRKLLYKSKQLRMVVSRSHITWLLVSSGDFTCSVICPSKLIQLQTGKNRRKLCSCFMDLYISLPLHRSRTKLYSASPHQKCYLFYPHSHLQITGGPNTPDLSSSTTEFSYLLHDLILESVWTPHLISSTRSRSDQP